MNQYIFEHLEDCSTADAFCFAIHCETCHTYWYSKRLPFEKGSQATIFRQKGVLYEALYKRQKNRALLMAVKEAKGYFSRCPICKRVVCNRCFIVCEPIGMCCECAARICENDVLVNEGRTEND